MKLPQTQWRTRPEMRRLLDVLGGDAGETRFVGGCVRDALLGVKVSDVDLATRLAPQEVIERLKAAAIKAVPTGLAHGTVTAVVGGRPVEVTTLRRDVATDGRRATVAFTDDWREDAARRDFTINALSAASRSGEVFDYFGGLADLDARLVRFIGDPLTRIAEDHLRILRFFRFHARFGAGDPDPEGLEACIARANDLMALSRERIADELLKLLALPDPAPTVSLIVTRGIFRPVLPEIADASRLARLVTLENRLGIAPDPLRRLAALLPTQPDIVDAVSARLRLSNGARKYLREMAEPADGARSARWIAGASSLFDREIVDLFLLSGLDEERIVAEVRSLDNWERPRFPLLGRDLLALGLPPGPPVARLLQQLRRAWCEADFPDAQWVRETAKTAVEGELRERPAP
ncbi:MAG TPA: CCA tRNA nucleotidyltransferase [Allosphingosinicella sp.]|nr:CCA tRNA nucleotidyltransferase [Allosphingosinicella sp.]